MRDRSVPCKAACSYPDPDTTKPRTWLRLPQQPSGSAILTMPTSTWGRLYRNVSETESRITSRSLAKRVSPSHAEVGDRLTFRRAGSWSPPFSRVSTTRCVLLAKKSSDQSSPLSLTTVTRMPSASQTIPLMACPEVYTAETTNADCKQLDEFEQAPSS